MASSTLKASLPAFFAIVGLGLVAPGAAVAGVAVVAAGEAGVFASIGGSAARFAHAPATASVHTTRSRVLGAALHGIVMKVMLSPLIHFRL
jgi:hypothetical protein